MKHLITVPTSEFLADLPRYRCDALLRLLRLEMNNYVDEADRLLERQPSVRGLRAVRDRGAHSAMQADSLEVTIKVGSARVTVVEIAIEGLDDLEQALGRIALRTFARPARDLQHTASEHAAAPIGATEGSASHGPDHPERHPEP